MGLVWQYACTRMSYLKNVTRELLAGMCVHGSSKGHHAAVNQLLVVEISS